LVRSEGLRAHRRKGHPATQDGLFFDELLQKRCFGLVYLKEAMALASSSLMSKTV
jgi:hypothetical protein